jgi:hypothetical protein
MKDNIEKAIEVLAEKITAETKPDDAMKYSQAALNLCHILQGLHNFQSYP